MTVNTIERWHELVAQRNEKGISALLSDEVVFYSPVVYTPQAGKAITTLYLTAALRVFGNDSNRCDTFHNVDMGHKSAYCGLYPRIVKVRS